ncbi:MAG TPA: O-antigen ligase family protein [Phycisphaerae bacterium]|nr:O-antigen ligase family protein [Phycisphaerae bacterium]
MTRNAGTIPARMPPRKPRQEAPQLRAAAPRLRPALKYPKLPLVKILAIGVPVLAVIYALSWASMPVAALVYALVYMAFASANPKLALVAVFASAPFIQDLDGGGPFRMSIGEINLALTVPVCILTCMGQNRPIRMGPPAVPIFLYLGLCLVSSLLHWDSEALTAYLQMTVYLVGAVLVFASFVRDPLDMHLCLDAAVIVGTVLAICALATDFGFPAMNKNAWGAITSTLVVIAMELWFATPSRSRRRLLMLAVLLLVTVLFLSLSRGSWLGALVGVSTVLLLRRQFKTLVRLLLVVGPLLAVLWISLPQEQKEYALGFDAGRANIASRIDTIATCKKLFFEHPLFGVGVSLRKEVDATNLVLITLAESGVFGLGLFLWMQATVLRMVWRTQKLLPRTHPLYTLLAAGAGMIACRMGHGLVDHYWSRGPILEAWAGVGMIVAVAACVRRPVPVARRKKSI